MSEIEKAELFSTVIIPILATVVSGVVAWVGMQIKKKFEQSENDRVKRAVAKTCVEAIEQFYPDLHGEEKYEKCFLNLCEMLTEKGIEIAELEARMLIESAVLKLNRGLKDEGN